MVLKACCYCVDLRKGSLISGYLLLVYHTAMLVLRIHNMVSIHSMVQGHYEIYFNLIQIILAFAIIVLLELIMTVVLLVGLHKNKPGAVLTSIVSTAILLLLNLALLIWITCENSWRYATIDWILAGLQLLSACLYVYFLTVFGSYYNKMRKGHDEETIGMKLKSYYA